MGKIGRSDAKKGRFLPKTPFPAFQSPATVRSPLSSVLCPRSFWLPVQFLDSSKEKGQSRNNGMWMTRIGRAGSPLHAGWSSAKTGAHGVTRPTTPRGRRSRVRRARAVRFPAGANVAQAFGHDAQAWAKYQCPWTTSPCNSTARMPANGLLKRGNAPASSWTPVAATAAHRPRRRLRPRHLNRKIKSEV